MRDLYSDITEISDGGMVLRRIRRGDLPGLSRLVSSENVYRYEPAFLFERRYTDTGYVIDRLYDECIKESLILGVFEEGDFCGLAEFYGYREPIHKISVGYRFLESCWGRGIATRTLAMMTGFLKKETDIEIITASTLPENKASERVLIKNGFELVARGADEDWGFDRPLLTDKWIL